jgi:NADPH:quinone reductase-like Zn-dependent oxidoreductase
MPSNRAAWLLFKKGLALQVKSAPFTSPPADHILVKTHAVAINPIDWIIQLRGDIGFTWLKYPCILGFDVAGEVVEVGKNVTRFKAGDRVIGLPRGTEKDINDSYQGGFQEYTVLETSLVSHIPTALSYENAAVIPLCFTTAAAGLFLKTQLSLQLPTAPASKSTGKTLIVWGGSTSVGCNAIQLGVAAGYEVFTTSSPSNFEYVKKLGASQVFDYKSKTVVPDMIKAMRGKTSAGALSIGKGAAEACMEVLNHSTGDKFVSMATFPVDLEGPKTFVLLQTVFHALVWIISYKLSGLIKGVKSNFITATEIAQSDVGKVLYEEFLPKALTDGTLVASPEPIVFGKGLESVQGAIDMQRKGVSAKKVVVSI